MATPPRHSPYAAATSPGGTPAGPLGLDGYARPGAGAAGHCVGDTDAFRGVMHNSGAPLSPGAGSPYASAVTAATADPGTPAAHYTSPSAAVGGGSAARAGASAGTPTNAAGAAGGCSTGSPADRFSPLARGLQALGTPESHHATTMQQQHQQKHQQQQQQQQQHTQLTPRTAGSQQQALALQRTPPGGSAAGMGGMSMGMGMDGAGGFGGFGAASFGGMPGGLGGMPGGGAFPLAAFPGMGPPGAGRGGEMRSMQAVAGVTKLMQQCSSMLRERMYMGAASPQQQQLAPARSPAPFDPQEVLFPVVDSVLGQITQEYEKRLLQKDHELSAARERAAVAQREAKEAQEKLEQLKSERAREAAAATRAAAAEATAAATATRGEVDALASALAEREAALAALRAEADAAAGDAAAREAALEAQLAETRAALAAVEDLESRYRRVVESNRALYNEVQDLKGAIRVFCRVRPPGLTGDASESCVDVGEEDDVIAVYNPARDDHREFRVNRVFDPSSTQDDVYADTQPLVRSVLDGYNVCIFAYGQTGSGKTHTMSGTNTRVLEGRGINYRALDDLFAIRDARRGEVDYAITVQMLEIYNETLRDLLADRGEAGRLDILSTMASGCNVPGAVQLEVDNPDDVAAIMARGAANRATSATTMNDRSSRSHQILTVIVDGYSHVTGSRSHGCLHLIDLAGSERVSKSEASGDRLVEAQHINRSLSALGDVIAALASRSAHVPFRNSKLTQLLQDSLCGQAKVMMFMHISPEASMYGESVSTLNFAKRVAEVTLGQAKRNVESGKVLRAHEALAAAKAASEAKDGQLRGVRAELAAARREAAAAAAAREAADKEARELRAQLAAESARREAPDRAPPPGPPAGPLPPRPPAAQPPAFGAASGGVSGAVPGAVLDSAARVASMDRSPARDQDGGSLLSTPPSAFARAAAAAGASGGVPAAMAASPALGAAKGSASKIPAPPETAAVRAVAAAGDEAVVGVLPTPRERESLATARSGYSSASGSSFVSRQPSEVSLGGLPAVERAGGAAALQSRRSSIAHPPLTARGSGIGGGGIGGGAAAAAKAALGGAAASARQSGTWGGAPRGVAGAAPAVSSRSTARAGGRWK